jgi:excisionase family DNA binding protein
VELRIDRPDHEQAADRTVGHAIEREYITTAEVAERLRWSKRTLRAKIQAGVFRRGEHFFQPPGCQYRWKWSAVANWVEGVRTPSGVDRLRPFASG